MYYLRRFTDRDELIQAIENYIYFYNHARFQKRLHCMTPMEFLMPMRHKKFPPCYKTEREHTTEYFCFFYCLLDRGHFINILGCSINIHHNNIYFLFRSLRKIATKNLLWSENHRRSFYQLAPIIEGIKFPLIFDSSLWCRYSRRGKYPPQP